jgi:hypothetical protein
MEMSCRLSGVYYIWAGVSNKVILEHNASDLLSLQYAVYQLLFSASLSFYLSGFCKIDVTLSSDFCLADIDYFSIESMNW